MATEVQTLKEFGESLVELAETWEGDQPIVLTGDIDSDATVQVRAKEGYTTFGPAGFAQECFEDNGVHALSTFDTRFYGTMLAGPEHLDDEALDHLGICRHCHELDDDCECPEAEEVA